MSALALLQFPNKELLQGMAMAWGNSKSWEELPDNCLFLQEHDSPEFLYLPVQQELLAFPELQLPLLPQHVQSTTQEEYESGVKASHERFRKKELEKTVISRRFIVKRPPHHSLLKSFQQLCITFPFALKSLVYESNRFCWMGASPELLVNVQGTKLETLSLAGTAVQNKEWSTKEEMEQAIVTRHIIQCLQAAGVKDFKQSMGNQHFGPLSHIRTGFSADISDTSFRLGQFIRQLHPTPAVVGSPQHKSLSFLRQQEKHERLFYTGLIGHKQNNNQASVYVNLRCASIYEHDIVLYAGAGITADSNPTAEWEESGAKINTILEQLLPE